MKKPSRTPRNYDGVKRTNHHMNEILPEVLQQIHKHIHNQTALVLASWPTVIGPKLASMTEAIRFTDGVLIVKVKNSTLYSLLSRHDKPKLLQKIKKQFPSVAISDLVFKIG